MTQSERKLPVLIPLAVMTLAYVSNIYINFRLYNAAGTEAENIIYLHILFEPIFWLVPVIFLLVLQRKAQTRVFPAPALILVGIAPLARLVSMLSLWLFYDILGSIHSLTVVFAMFVLTLHPMGYLLIQTVFITNLWFKLFWRDED